MKPNPQRLIFCLMYLKNQYLCIYHTTFIHCSFTYSFFFLNTGPSDSQVNSFTNKEVSKPDLAWTDDDEINRVLGILHPDVSQNSFETYSDIDSHSSESSPQKINTHLHLSLSQNNKSIFKGFSPLSNKPKNDHIEDIQQNRPRKYLLSPPTLLF